MVRYQYDRPDLDLLGPAQPPVQASESAPRSEAVPQAAEKTVSKPRRRFPAVRLLLLTAALTGMAVLGGTLARYWKEWSDNSLVTAGNFYFTGEEIDGSLRQLTADSDGFARFSFTLRNYMVAGYATQSEIQYTCAVTDEKGNVVTQVQWSNSDSTSITEGVADGALSGAFAAGTEGTDNSQSRELICAIPTAAFGTDGKKELTVRAQATEPYSALLTAHVTLAAGNGGVVLVVTDPGTGAVSVTLYNTSGQERRGTLAWPTTDLELVPDETWEIQPGKEDGTLTVPAEKAVSVVFLKKSTRNRFTESDFSFTVTENSN